MAEDAPKNALPVTDMAPNEMLGKSIDIVVQERPEEETSSIDRGN